MAPVVNKNLVSDNQVSFLHSEEKQEQDFHHFQVNGELGVISIREHKLVAILEERLEIELVEDAYFKYEAEKECREEEDYLKEQQKIEDAKEKLQKEREEEWLREWLRKESEKRELEIAEHKMQEEEYERAEELKDQIRRKEYERELEEEQIRMDANLEA